MWRLIAIAAVSIVLPLFAVRQTIRKIDFKNTLYAWDEPTRGIPSKWQWLDDAPHGSVQLKMDGTDSQRGASLPYLRLISVTYGDLDGDGREEAAVDLLYSGGGTANWHYLYVYALDGRQPKLLAVLESGSRADGGLMRVKIQKQSLILLRTANCEWEIAVRKASSASIIAGYEGNSSRPALGKKASS